MLPPWELHIVMQRFFLSEYVSLNLIGCNSIMEIWFVWNHVLWNVRGYVEIRASLAITKYNTFEYKSTTLMWHNKTSIKYFVTENITYAMRKYKQNFWNFILAKLTVKQRAPFVYSDTRHNKTSIKYFATENITYAMRKYKQKFWNFISAKLTVKQRAPFVYSDIREPHMVSVRLHNLHFPKILPGM